MKKLIIFSLLISCFFSFSILAETNVLDVTLGLDIPHNQFEKLNPNYPGSKEEKNKKDGIMQLMGPIDFNFLYGEGNLNFSDIKTIIYPVENDSIKYIHIYPQMQKLNQDSVIASLNTIDKQLMENNWRVTFRSEPGILEQAVRMKRKADYAVYRYSEKDGSGTQKLEIVVTVQRSILSECSTDGENYSPECKNKYIRIGFYTVQ